MKNRTNWKIWQKEQNAQALKNPSKPMKETTKVSCNKENVFEMMKLIAIQTKFSNRGTTTKP